MSLFSILFGKAKDDLQDEINDVKNNLHNNVSYFSGNFLMKVDDVFTITGRGTVVTGNIEKGTVTVEDDCFVNGNIPVKITGIECFRKMLTTASQGENVGLLLKGIEKNQISKGDTITK